MVGMAMSTAVLVTLACLPVGAAVGRSVTVSGEQEARQLSLEAAWGQELQTEDARKSTSPLKRVISVLAKMKAELVAEADNESDMYDKMVCWCESNTKEKMVAVAEAETKDKELSAEIETRSARFGELATKIASAKKEIAANVEMLKQATAIREREAAEFRGEEKDTLQAVTNLRSAIAVLAKHQGSQSLLQLEGATIAGLRVVLRSVALKYEEMQAGRSEREAFEAHRAALLSLQARTARRAAGDGAEGVDARLISALNVKDSSVTDALPLHFAVELVARAGQPTPTGAAGPADKFLQVTGSQPIFSSRSSARSGTIYGILAQMLEDFEAELSTTQKEELQAQADFKALAETKSAQIEAGKKKLDEMEVDAAANQKSWADAREDLTLTREQRSTEVKFLQNLKLTCNDLDTQWQKRSQTRAMETKAVAEAIAVLTQDDNRETVARSVSLLQLQRGAKASIASEASLRRSSAADVLRRAAAAPALEADDLLAAWHSRTAATLGAAAGPQAQLSTLAVAVQLNDFTKVKEMIDKMLANLKEEQAHEVEVKAHCGDELHSNKKTVYDKTELKQDLETKIGELEQLLDRLAGEIATAKDTITKGQVEIKRAGETREKENVEFQSVVSDQRATQAILKKALEKLKDFYEKGIGNATLLQRAKKKQEPPVKFNSYKVNGGGSAVIGLIEQILEDSKRLEAETMDEETAAQARYEQFVQDSNGMIKNLQEGIISRTKAIASTKRDSAEANEELENTRGELESLAAYEADLHNQCDFLIKNFDVRQQARVEEMEAIQQAKAILSGAAAK